MHLVTRARTLPGLVAGLPDLVDIEVTDGVITGIHLSAGSPIPGAIDADGAVVLPGLWDSHVHLAHQAVVATAIDVSGTDSPDEVIDIVRREAANRSGDDLLLGFGFLASHWGDPPTAAMLDDVSQQPIALISGDAHTFWANRAGLALAGAGYHPNGFLVEQQAFDAQATLMEQGAHHVDRAVAEVCRVAAARGVTGVVDMQMGWNVGSWQRRASTAVPLLRVEAATYPEDLERLISAGHRTGDRIAERVTVGPLKIIADGSLHSRTALCTHEYPDPLPGLPHGKANYAHLELKSLLGRATANGIHAAVHAIGDLAVSWVLDAFEATGAKGSVEHAQYVTQDNIRRFAELGVGASVQPAHLLDDADILDELWPEAGPQAFPLRSLTTAGATLLLGSDAPVSTLDPWVAMDAAVNRSHHPDEALTPLEALRASVRTTLAPGQPADIILAATTRERLLAGELLGTEILATFIDGRPTHTA